MKKSRFRFMAGKKRPRKAEKVVVHMIEDQDPEFMAAFEESFRKRREVYEALAKL